MIGNSNGYAAVVAVPLPSTKAWDRALAADLSAAYRGIGRLAGDGGRLGDPHLKRENQTSEPYANNAGVIM